MLWTIPLVLLFFWLLGITGAFALGAWVHILLVLAVISVLVNATSGKWKRA